MSRFFKHLFLPTGLVVRLMLLQTMLNKYCSKKIHFEIILPSHSHPLHSSLLTLPTLPTLPTAKGKYSIHQKKIEQPPQAPLPLPPHYWSLLFLPLPGHISPKHVHLLFLVITRPLIKKYTHLFLLLLFSLNRPLSRFSLYLAMCVCLFVAVSLCLHSLGFTKPPGT